MKRVIIHWTAGPHKATRLDKKHYHFIVEGDGNVVVGNNPVSANRKIVKGKPYAAHTYRSNTGSIGISMACMVGAKWPSYAGKQPMTEVQFEACMKKVAELCKKYDIEVSPQTVLSHAEVTTNLGIKQKGKWDFTILPFKPALKGAKACGDYARERVMFHMTGVKSNIKDSRIAYLQKLLTMGGYDLLIDGVVGAHTEQAINQFQEAHHLEKSGEFDEDTVFMLRLTYDTAFKPKKNNVSEKPLTRSRTVGGALTAGTGGATILIEPVKEVVEVVTEQKDALSSGSIVSMIIGGIVIAGAVYTLYARWDDAGRPKFWKES